MTDFLNRNEAEHWFGNQPREICIAMAARSALRVFPLCWSYIYERQLDRSNAFAQPLLRAMALPLVTGSWPASSEAVRPAAAHAAANVFTANASIAYAATAIAYAANAAASTAATDDAGANTVATYAAASITNAATATASYAAIRHAVDAYAAATATDAEAVESGITAAALCRMPLWPEIIPEDIGDGWSRLSRLLLDLDPNWSVWTEWYEDRLCGADDPRSRPLIEELEVERALIPDEEWEKGATHVNALIAEMEAKYRANVPEQKPASAQFEWGADEKLHLRPPPPPEARDAAQDQRLRLAWSAHEEILSALEALDPGRNAPAFGRALKAYRKAMGGIYDELNVIGLGIYGQRIEAFAKRADDILMEDAAAELDALVGSYGMFIPQFDDWLAYRDGARKELPTAEVNAASTVAVSIASDPEQADAAAAEALRESAAAVDGDQGVDLRADPYDRPSKEAGENVIRVVWNALVAKLAPALKAAREGSVEGIKWAFKRAVGITALEGLAKLLEIAPGDFSWAGYVVKAIKALAKDVIG